VAIDPVSSQLAERMLQLSPGVGEDNEEMLGNDDCGDFGQTEQKKIKNKAKQKKKKKMQADTTAFYDLSRHWTSRHRLLMAKQRQQEEKAEEALKRAKDRMRHDEAPRMNNIRSC
jgi:hypothetical protein